MKIIIQLLVSAFCGFGLGFILSDVFRIPKYPVSKAIKSLGKRKNKQISRLEIWLGDFSNLIASKLRLNEYKRLQLKADLESADMTLSPEQYVGNAIVKSVLVAVLAIPFLFFAPLISLVMIIIAIAVYVGEYGKVGKIIREKRRKIEYELPRLVSSIDKTLIHSRDVLGILDSYRITHESEDGALATLNRIEKNISDQGFEVKRADKDDIKRFLSRYFGHMTEDAIDDVDGERMIKKWIIPD